MPVPRESAKEVDRINKWERMMVVAKRDEGGNVQVWGWDARKGRKVSFTYSL